MTDTTEQLATTLQLMERCAEEVREAVHHLLDHVQLSYYDPNAGGGELVFVAWNPYHWGELQPGAQRYVGEARRLWESFYELVQQAVRRSAPERLKRLEQSEYLLRRIIEQDDTYGPPADSVRGVREASDEALGDIIAMLRELPAAHGDGGKLLVPDTNALLYKPELADWQLPGSGWTVVLMPQVLRELDYLKMRRDIGEKAAGVIRRVKEYARRGNSFTGVPIKGSLQMREVAIDADMTDTLPWLRAGHADDELLASVLELRCQDLCAVVAIATRDRNLQNKARLAGCPYLDVEDEL